MSVAESNGIYMMLKCVHLYVKDLPNFNSKIYIEYQKQTYLELGQFSSNQQVQESQER